MTSRLHWAPAPAHFGDRTFVAYVNGITITRLHTRRKVRGYRVHGETHATLHQALAAAGRMSRGVTGNGLLRHRFGGSTETYSAVIGLKFADQAHAVHALKYVGAGWKFAPNEDAALVWFGNHAELQSCIEILARFGADPRKVNSVATSIDFGEPFTVTFPEAP